MHDVHCNDSTCRLIYNIILLLIPADKSVVYIAVETKAQLQAGQLLEAVDNAERERAAAPDEVPLGEWTAFRVRPNLTSQSLTTQLQLTSSAAPPGQVSWIQAEHWQHMLHSKQAFLEGQHCLCTNLADAGTQLYYSRSSTHGSTCGGIYHAQAERSEHWCSPALHCRQNCIRYFEFLIELGSCPHGHHLSAHDIVTDCNHIQHLLFIPPYLHSTSSCSSTLNNELLCSI